MKRIEDISDFKKQCVKKYCPRHTMVNHKCATSAKQEDCWNKYNTKMDKGGYMSDRPNAAIKVKLPPKKIYEAGKLPLKQKGFQYNSTLKRSTKPIKVNIYDPEYSVFRNQVWQRELKIDMPANGYYRNWTKACQFWKCLSDKEKQAFLDGSKGAEWMYTTIHVCHIKAKGAHADLKYDPNNAVLGNFVFHSRIDTYRDPITNKAISADQQAAWFLRIKNHTAILDDIL